MDEKNLNAKNMPNGLIFVEESAKPPESALPYRQQYISQSIQPDALIQQLNQQNAQAVQGIIDANYCLGQNVVNVTNEMHKTLYSLRREKAKKKEGKDFKVDEEGWIVICQCYDDGSEKILGRLSNELYFPIHLHRLIVPEENKEHMEVLRIEPGDEDYICYMALEKITGKKIYESMNRVGIKFNLRFKPAEIHMILERMLVPMIRRAESVLIHHLSGWVYERGDFIQGPLWQDWALDCPLPRDSKILDGEELSTRSLQEYIQYFLKIRDEKLRLMFWIYPFLGLSNELLEKNGLCFTGILNLVVSDSVKVQNAISFFLKTYARNKSGNLSMLDKSIIRYIGECKDEVLIIKSSEAAGTYYEKTKRKSLLQRIVKFAQKEQDLPEPFNRELLGAICLLTSSAVDAPKVIHMYVDEQDFDSKLPKLGMQNQDIMRDVWYGFVEWVEDNWQNVQIEIQLAAEKCEANEDVAVFKAVYRLVDRYFASLGLDFFYKRIGLLSEPDFEVYFPTESVSESIQFFITQMRKTIQRFYVQDIRLDRTCPLNDDTFFFDSNYLQIRKRFFETLAAKMGIKDQRKLLVQLLEENMIVANTDTYYSTLQLSTERFRTVKMRLELFERIGETDIIDLGKERKANA